MSDDGHIPIRSYRLCFELERRIHRVDRWRIPVPYGVPLRGIAYAALALLGLLMLSRLPLVGSVAGAIHPALRLIVVPCAGAALLVRMRVDGRSAHAHLGALLRQGSHPRWVAGFKAVPGSSLVRLADVELASDGRAAHFRRSLIRGPCRVLVRYPATGSRRGRTITLRQIGTAPLWRGKAVEVPSHGRFLVRS